MHTTTQLAAQAMRSGAPAAKVAHAALFERIMERIHRYFCRMLRNQHEAEDCTQRTLTLLEESLVHGKYQPDRSFNTWMWLKAHTVFAQWCRERERMPKPLGEEGRLEHPGSPQQGVERSIDAHTVLERVLEELGEEVYEIFVLYYEGGLTQEEVASAVERDRKTVRKRLRQAHELIDRLLK